MDQIAELTLKQQFDQVAAHIMQHLEAIKLKVQALEDCLQLATKQDLHEMESRLTSMIRGKLNSEDAAALEGSLDRLKTSEKKLELLEAEASKPQK